MICFGIDHNVRDDISGSRNLRTRVGVRGYLGSTEFRRRFDQSIEHGVERWWYAASARRKRGARVCGTVNKDTVRIK
jgi:hypothetical protein